MSENQNKPIKERLKQIEEKLDSLTNTKWAKNLRITSGVFWNLFLVSIIFGITLTIFAASVGAGYFASLVAKEPLRSKDEMRSTIFSYEETSEIYAGDVYIGPVSADITRKEIKLEEVSPYVIDAVLATEDEYFETHEGIVPKAIFRGLFQDVTNADSQTGGSTLTQQLIKLQILTNEVSYERKAKEILLAMRLEHFMDKHEILEAYLNIIPYGRNSNGDNIAGIEAAAEGIFDLKAKDLNLAQSAYIAGIPQAPFAYTPFYNQNQWLKEDEGLKPGINRMKTVLFRMKETGYITESEYNEAMAYDIKSDFREAPLRTNERYPYLTQEIQNRTIDVLAKVLAEKDGIDPERLENEGKLKDKYSILARREMTSGGYRIYSTIDLKLYNHFQKVSKDYNDKFGPTRYPKGVDKETGETIELVQPVQVGSMAIENSTGKILSFVGGRDFEVEKLNHATQAPREVGSSIKPLLIYGPAIEYGHIGAGSPIADVWFQTTKYGLTGSGKPYSPKNFIKTEQMGVIPARQALASSQNVAATRLYEQIIDKRPLEFLEKMGYSKVTPLHYAYLSSALGPINATVEENVGAFATLANNGQFIEPYIIERIEDMDGNIVFQHETEPVDVFSPQTAYIITDMLRDVLTNRRGTAQIMKQNLNFNLDLAAKTGTSDDFGDAWLVGYNPNITLGVWIGYKYRNDSLEYGENKYGPPSARVNKLYANFMNGINEVRPEILKADSKFKIPEGVVTRSMCGISGLAPSAECSAAGLVTSDLFNANVFVPTKPDDSLTSSSYVQMNGKKYRALPSTPKEFVVSKGGIGVTQDYIDWILRPFGGNPEYLFPNNSSFAKNVISETKFEADDAAPAAVSLKLTDKKITWAASASKDVIGYYVYSGDKKIATIHDGASYSHSIGPGSYTVKAVDITGKLSGASNTISLEKEEEPPEEEPEKPKDPPKDEKPGKPKDPPKDEKPKPEKPGKPGKPEDPPEDEDPPGTDPPDDEE
ncbi:transglycosylase domain-containing protein [Sporosarcina sp. Marseille-Q4063]|uniref:transglycosylase domain-containing protein n=1 Tax=Sporosarcina sp. Marseille-Q4063 TaxID=2810514 RepID=UPI002016A359|nr:transglycosylase domain-containing protein [Sporosarcina sp. Marseille-Q4063]